MSTTGWARSTGGDSVPGVGRIWTPDQRVRVFRIQDEGGVSYRHFSAAAQFRIDRPDGKPAGAAYIMREVTGYGIAQCRLALADEASTRIGTTLDVTRTAGELLEVAIPRLADAGAVDLLATVIERDHLSRRPRDGKMRLRRVALRWPADVPAPPDYTRHTWGETDPAELYCRCLVTGSPVYLPAFGAMAPEQIRDTQADADLSAGC